MRVAHDASFMERALFIARGQAGRTAPNPSVGCVIVKDGVIIGEGVTADGGRPHAEEIALDRAGAAARGATVYVTLEPCGARSGGGPGCAERLALAGVERVVMAVADPSPFAAGLGLEILTAAGVSVDQGLMAEAVLPLYAAWLAAHGRSND